MLPSFLAEAIYPWVQSRQYPCPYSPARDTSRRRWPSARFQSGSTPVNGVGIGGFSGNKARLRPRCVPTARARARTGIGRGGKNPRPGAAASSPMPSSACSDCAQLIAPGAAFLMCTRCRAPLCSRCAHGRVSLVTPAGTRLARWRRGHPRVSARPGVARRRGRRRGPCARCRAARPGVTMAAVSRQRQHAPAPSLILQPRPPGPRPHHSGSAARSHHSCVTRGTRWRSTHT
jgi:hypothetical protein